ncbi:MAG: hypothetical protein ABH868_06040 [bacterium]
MDRINLDEAELKVINNFKEKHPLKITDENYEVITLECQLTNISYDAFPSVELFIAPYHRLGSKGYENNIQVTREDFENLILHEFGHLYDFCNSSFVKNDRENFLKWKHSLGNNRRVYNFFVFVWNVFIDFRCDLLSRPFIRLRDFREIKRMSPVEKGKYEINKITFEEERKLELSNLLSSNTIGNDFDKICKRCRKGFKHYKDIKDYVEELLKV